MPLGDTIISIDNYQYISDFQGFDKPMTAKFAHYPSIQLQVWTLRLHLQALSIALVASADGAVFDEQILSHQILQHSNVPSGLYRYYAPLALWWASGNQCHAVQLQNNQYQLGSFKAELKAWTLAERFRALNGAYKEQDGYSTFDLMAYIFAMLKTCVISDQQSAIEDLDSASFNALLNALVKLNIATSQSVIADITANPNAIELTLRLCRALGWTPSQILNTPANEIDVIIELLNQSDFKSQSLTSNKAPSLKDYPDSVIIQVEDD